MQTVENLWTRKFTAWDEYVILGFLLYNSITGTKVLIVTITLVRGDVIRHGYWWPTSIFFWLLNYLVAILLIVVYYFLINFVFIVAFDVNFAFLTCCKFCSLASERVFLIVLMRVFVDLEAWSYWKILLDVSIWGLLLLVDGWINNEISYSCSVTIALSFKYNISYQNVRYSCLLYTSPSPRD